MSLQLEIVTPEKKVFSDTVENVYLPGTDGELGILEAHASLVSGLKPGELRYQKGGQSFTLALGSGFAEVTGHKVVVLTDSALGEAEIDEAKAEAAIHRAENAREVAGVVVAHKNAASGVIQREFCDRAVMGFEQAPA